MGKIKKALITGITGQDGSYLTEFLLRKKYKVYGLVRRVALEDETHRLWRIKHLLNKIELKSASLESYASIVKIIQKIKPDEIYHLGAQSYVAYSFEDEFSTLNTNINGTHYILSAIKDFSPKTKFYFAGSSEMFGKVQKKKQEFIACMSITYTHPVCFWREIFESFHRPPPLSLSLSIQSFDTVKLTYIHQKRPRWHVKHMFRKILYHGLKNIVQLN